MSISFLQQFQSERVLKCDCCKSSNAVFIAKIPGNEYRFCWRCSKQHNYSPDYPGFELKHESINPRPPPDNKAKTVSIHFKSIFKSSVEHCKYIKHNILQRRVPASQYQTCYCCQKVYVEKSCTRLDYECGKHSFVFCINCAPQHEYCLEDTCSITKTARYRLEELEEADPDKEPFELA